MITHEFRGRKQGDLGVFCDENYPRLELKQHFQLIDLTVQQTYDFSRHLQLFTQRLMCL